MAATTKKAPKKTKGKAGRITCYDPKRHPVIARMLRACGRTMEDVALAIGVTRPTLNNWAKANPEFADALQMGLIQANAQVVDSLFKRAIGYEYEEVKTVVTKDADGRPISRVERTKKQVAPDVGACCFWLKNRESEEWSDVNDIRLKGRLDHGIVAVDEAAEIRARLDADPAAREAVREAFSQLYPPPGKNAH